MMGLTALACTAEVPIGRFPSPSISNSALIRAERLLGGHALLAVLFPLNWRKDFTQPLSCLVELGIRGAFGASQHPRDLGMLIPLDIVQDKYCARPRRQLRDAAAEIDSINRPLQ